MIKTIGINIISIFFGIFLGLIILEGLLRIIEDDEEWLILNEANIVRNLEFEYEIKGLYAAEYDSIIYRRDKYGLRGGCSNPSDIDILTIGGSTTDQRYLSIDFTFQELLKNRIYRKFGKDVCISNAGVDGHTTHGHLFSFQHWFKLIPELRPKFIFLYIGINDAVFDRAFSPMPGADVGSNLLKGYLKQLMLVQKLLPVYRYIQSGFTNKAIAYAGHFPKNYRDNDYLVSQLDARSIQFSEINAIEFKKRLNKILSQIRLMGSQPICVSQPHRYTKTINSKKLGVQNVFQNFSGLDYEYSISALNKVMSNLCKENFIEINSDSFLESSFYDGVHLTPEGSQILSDLLLNEMIARGYISKL